MFPIAHLGIGRRMATPWKLKTRILFIGCLLPDLIDKPVYYLSAYSTGRWAEAIGLISGTRTFGHTLIFGIFLFILGGFKKSELILALAVGSATHLVLDVFGTVLEHGFQRPEWLLWPVFGWTFPSMPYGSLEEHFWKFLKPSILGGEVLGALFLIQDFLRWRARMSETASENP